MIRIIILFFIGCGLSSLEPCSTPLRYIVQALAAACLIVSVLALLAQVAPLAAPTWRWLLAH